MHNGAKGLQLDNRKMANSHSVSIKDCNGRALALILKPWNANLIASSARNVPFIVSDEIVRFTESV